MKQAKEKINPLDNGVVLSTIDKRTQEQKKSNIAILNDRFSYRVNKSKDTIKTDNIKAQIKALNTELVSLTDSKDIAVDSSTMKESIKSNVGLDIDLCKESIDTKNDNPIYKNMLLSRVMKKVSRKQNQ